VLYDVLLADLRSISS